MAFEPIPCESCGSTGGVGPPELDTEQLILCDVNAEGEVVGTALMATVYDSSGTPVGPPQPFNPATGEPYVAVGTLQPCPGETGCLEPVQFCFTSTTTGPVDHPGRMYDADLPVNPGFALESIVVDGVVTPQNLVWDVNDSTGQAFADELETRLGTLLPAAGTITVTPPGSQNCGTNPSTFAIHIECLRLDQEPPDIIRFNYNGGEDLIQNPAYNETPPLNPPVSQGNYGYRLLAREDDPGPFPGFPPAERADCTSVANRGWETNDSGRTFEIWGQDVAVGVTPTPRGTPIQEVNSDGNPGDGGTTIWQTFQVTTGGNFTIRLVHGGRDPGETHTIRLSTGDTDATGPGDIINDVTANVPVVYGGAWTVLNQVVALAPGLYTFSFKSNNPTGNNARGGLFTDMRAFVDVPGLFVDSVRDDETCVVTTEETSETTICQYWSPLCVGGDITAWKNAENGDTLDNAAFWGQVPSPECCTATASGGGGTVTPGNMVHTYLVCGVVGGIPTTLSRVVYTNQSGGVVAGAFIGADGGPVAPSSWTPGACVVPQFPLRDTELVELCDFQPGGAIVPFVRRMTFDATGTVVSASNIDANGAPYIPAGNVGRCDGTDVECKVLCDTFEVIPGNPTTVNFIRCQVFNPDSSVLRVDDYIMDGETPYVVQGAVDNCLITENPVGWESICYTLTSTGDTIHAGTKRHDDDFPTPGFAIFDAEGNPVNTAADGYTQVPCIATSTLSETRDAEVLVLCDSAAVPVRFLRKYLYDGETGAPVGFVNTTLDGATPFAPTGAVGVCTTTIATDLDFDQVVMCDSNGTQFIRRYTFNSTTGAVTATTNLTMAGAAFAPVGAVGLCTECCPVVIGEGCTNVGSLRYTAIRNTNGTISLIDSVSGAAVAGANVVPCASDDTVKTLNAQHRLIGDADAAWTPGADVVGVLTGVTYTIISGTATVLDSNGTSAAGLPAGLTATWSAEDDNTLTGPQSIDAIGGQTYVVWTQK